MSALQFCVVSFLFGITSKIGGGGGGWGVGGGGKLTNHREQSKSHTSNKLFRMFSSIAYLWHFLQRLFLFQWEINLRIEEFSMEFMCNMATCIPIVLALPQHLSSQTHAERKRNRGTTRVFMLWFRLPNERAQIKPMTHNTRIIFQN